MERIIKSRAAGWSAVVLSVALLLGQAFIGSEPLAFGPGECCTNPTPCPTFENCCDWSGCDSCLAIQEGSGSECQVKCDREGDGDCGDTWTNCCPGQN